MAQAPLDPNGEPTAVMVFRYPVSKRERLRRQAKARGMTVSDYVRSILEPAMDADDAELQEVVATAS